MSLAHGSMKRPVTVTMLTVAALVFGIVALQRLPLNLLPDISYPTLTIRTEYADAAPGEIEKLVTEPLEESVAVVRGLRGLRSKSQPGASEIVLEFGWKTEMDYAALDVREKIDTVRLPDDADTPVLLRYDPSLDPILRIGLYGEKDPVTLRQLGERVLKKDLESLLGVASVRVYGGLEEQIQVEVDEGKLAALDIPIATVSRFLREQNLNAAGGRLRDRESEYLVRTLNEFTNLDDLGETILFEENGRQIALRDVATIERGFEDRDVITRVSGQEAVELALYKEGDANTVQVARAVKERLSTLEDRLPEGVQAQILSDQSIFIEQSVNEVRNNAILGGLLAILVLYLFLKQRKPTSIIAAVIPISIISTFFAMLQFGVSLNIMSLGGLALGVGMLVDNAIVVLEAIHRHQQMGKSIWDSTRDGSAEVSRAVIASTLTTVAVFLPIIFVEGIAGQIFRDQALTVTASLIVSLIAALTLIPMLSTLGGRPARPALTAEGVGIDREESVFADERDGEMKLSDEVAGAPPGRARRFARRAGAVLGFLPRWIARTVFILLPAGLIFLGRWGFAIGARVLGWILMPAIWVFDRFWSFLERAYPGLLRFSLAHRGVTLGVALGLAALAVAWYPRLGTDLVPQFSQGQFSFDLELPPGTPLWKTESQVREIEEKLAGDPRVEILYTSIGESPDLNAAGTQRQENLAQLGLTVADPSGEEGLVAAVREILDDSNFRYTFRRPSYFSFRTPVEVHLYGYDLEELHTYGTALAARLSDLEGLADVRCNLQDGSPEVQIEFRRDRMASFDLDLESVARTLRNKIRGDVATRFKEQDRQLDILVRTAEASALDISQVRSLVVSQVEGVPIPLASVADVRLGNGPSEITHIDQQRAAIVRANLSGRDLGSATKDIKEVLADFPPPPSLSADLGGQNDEVATSFRSLLLAVTLAAFMVYMVMASQFESFLHPFVILLTVPLGLVGVIFALGLTGTTVSVVVLIGTVMLTGIVVNNAIVLVDFINQRRKAGLAKLDAIADAGSARLRPILMTTTTTVLGLLPMAIGLGEGAEIRAPMAIAVIGGLVFTTALTLLVIPVVYATLDRTA